MNPFFEEYRSGHILKYIIRVDDLIKWLDQWSTDLEETERGKVLQYALDKILEVNERIWRQGSKTT